MAVAKLVNPCYSAPRIVKEQMGIWGPLGYPRQSEEMGVCLCTLVPDGATPPPLLATPNTSPSPVRDGGSWWCPSRVYWDPRWTAQ